METYVEDLCGDLSSLALGTLAVEGVLIDRLTQIEGERAAATGAVQDLKLELHSGNPWKSMEFPRNF